jgi:hypothetical protein
VTRVVVEKVDTWKKHAQKASGSSYAFFSMFSTIQKGGELTGEKLGDVFVEILSWFPHVVSYQDI